MKKILIFFLLTVFIATFAIGALAESKPPKVDCEEDPDDPRCKKYELEPKPGGSDSIRIIIIDDKMYECLETADGLVNCRRIHR